MSAREIGDQIAAAVAKLPEDQRTAIVLSEYHGMSYAEIAGGDAMFREIGGVAPVPRQADAASSVPTPVGVTATVAV